MKVSIVLCTYNRQDFIVKCLDSLRRQTFKNFELIVVNDNSTDRTKSILKDYSRKYDKIKIINNTKNKGVSGARNSGIRKAKGEIIAFLDDDCIADKNWLNELIKPYKNQDIIGVGGRITNPKPSNLAELANEGLNDVANKSGVIDRFIGGNMSFRTSFIKKIRFDETLKYGSDEWDVCATAKKHGHKLFYQHTSRVTHYHPSTFGSLIRQQYKNGLGNVWYKKKHKMFFYPRHLIAGTISLLLLPFLWMKYIISAFLFFMAIHIIISVFYEDMKVKRTIWERIISSPYIVMKYYAQATGAFIGVLRFWVVK